MLDERVADRESGRQRARRPALAHGHEPVVLVEGQRAQDDRVHHREDRRRGADAERQHEQRDDGEARRRAKLADGVAQIGMSSPPNRNHPRAGGAESATRAWRSGAR